MLRRRIAVAQGRQPGDLLLSGGRVVNVFTGEVEVADESGVQAIDELLGAEPVAKIPASVKH